MDLLKRNLAPIVEEAWALIDDEARSVLTERLAARKLVDFDGPHGWGLAAVNTGRVELLDAQPVPDVHIGLRRVLPLVELRTPIRLELMELDTIGRGGVDPNLLSVTRAAERMASAEDAAVFNGYGPERITGILEASPHEPRRVREVTDLPRAIIDGTEVLRQAGVTGPYAVALGPRMYDELLAASPEGYPLVKQVERQIVEGPVVRADPLEGGVVMSVRGGDYRLTVGQDHSVGYAHRDAHTVELYLTESFTFRVLEPKAAIGLTRA